MPAEHTPLVISLLKESPYIVILVNSLTSLSGSVFTSIRMSRCDDVSCCCGLCNVHRTVLNDKEYELTIERDNNNGNGINSPSLNLTNTISSK